MMDNRQKKYCFLALLLAGCVATSFLSNSKEKEKPLPLAMPVQAVKQTKMIKVYVSGAVMEPGIYELPLGVRADVALAAAGGVRENANMEKVNLARKLKDGQQVNVPSLKIKSSRGSNALPMAPLTANGAAISAWQGKVRINSASLEELDTLPGVGPAMARRIIAHRQRSRFNSLADLCKVRGLGKNKIARLQEYISFD